MARIIGAVAVSHTPTIGFAVDRNKHDDPVWQPIFEAFAPAQRWLAEKKPDVLFVVFNDHLTSFFFDHYSVFALGVGESYEPADEGGTPRDLPPLRGHTKLAQHVAGALVADEFDMSFFQQRPLDHGLFSPLSALLPHEREWPTTVVPLQVGVLQFPLPTAMRCYKLGQAIRRAVESYPEDITVAMVGTGGLSHQISGERAGFLNGAWDVEFMNVLEKDPVALAEMTHAQLAELGGIEGAEVIMWLVMRGALSASVTKLHQAYYAPSMTGIGVAIYENHAAQLPVDTQAPYRAQIARQLAGSEKLAGTYPYTLERSVKAYRVNKFLHDMVIPEHRRAFLDDEEATMNAAGLTPEERDLVRRRDWIGMIRYGVIFFALEKLGAATGISNLHIYAAERGISLEEFQQTRNAPSAMYSNAGKDANLSWDKQPAESSVR